MCDENSIHLPILLIGYSRTERIQKIVLTLISYGVDRIYVALDFSEDLNIRVKQEELVKFLTELDDDRIIIWYRQKNHGVAMGVITALDWFFYFNERGIVIEDDLEFGNDFLEFCKQALNRYSKDSILMVSGNRFDVLGENDAVAGTNYPQIWGWATWRDNWRKMRELILKEKKYSWSYLFRPNMSFFLTGAQRVFQGNIDTWDVPLAFEMLKTQAICLLPPVNLVTNNGYDIHAIHTKDKVFPLGLARAELREVKWLEFEEVQKTVTKTNDFLERRVFGVNALNVLSPLKLLMQDLFSNSSKRQSNALVHKLEEVEHFQRKG